ncbi:hypothetical protein [Roseospira marina]|nr:hypothetical protein [Roseospira marina]MBB4316052.1 hypothetical protein [Roseospira marina]MBB5089230.1 hypothetical protein [Roseospira marina]
MDRTVPPIVSARLEEIAQVIGPVAALRLAEAMGGQEKCYIPHTPHPGHPWALLLGADAWAALCQEYGGTHIDVPSNALARSHKARMGALKRRGLSHRAIARELGCSERWVRMALNAGDERQPDLFAGD